MQATHSITVQPQYLNLPSTTDISGSTEVLLDCSQLDGLNFKLKY